MPTVRGGARLPGAQSDRLNTLQRYGSSTERFPQDGRPERMNFKRQPRFLLKCFAIVVCGSVSLIAISALVWAYDRSLQADVIRARSDLEHKLIAVEANLKASESRNAKLIQDCSAVKTSNPSNNVPKENDSTIYEIRSEDDHSDNILLETQKRNETNIISPRTNDAPW
jgi:hypothetical protein